MGRKSIIFKVWISIISLLLFTIIFLGLFFSNYLEDSYQNFEIESLTKRAEHVAEVIIYREDEEIAREIIWELAREMEVSFLLELRGHIFGSVVTGPVIDDLASDLHLSLEETQRIYRGQTVIKEQSAKDRARIIMVSVPIVQRNLEVVGIVSAYKATSNIADIINQANMLIVYTLVIALLLSIIMVIYITKRVADPLVQMNNVAKKMAAGRFTGRIEVTSDDEIGTLGRTMNAMAIELNSTIRSLNKEKDQINSILTSMSDAVITLSRDRMLSLANPPANQILEKWVSNYDKDLIYSYQILPVNLSKMIDQAYDSQEKSNFDITINSRVYNIIIDILYLDDAFNGIVLVIRDVTEERQLDKLRRDFVANVSHELRTPLSMLQSYSEALLDDIADDAETRRELTEVIHDESLRMKGLVNDLLDLAKLEAGQIELNKSTFELNNFLETLSDKYKVLHPDKNFYFNSYKEELYVYADGDRLQQVLINLVDNAVRHTGDDGEIKLNLNQDKNIRIVISDNGLGIESEDLAFIFDRFYKSDKARTRSKSGTGLGLAISKNIIEAHGGRIWIESEVNKGTSVIIDLPKLAN